MYAVRLWSVRHSRRLEAFYKGFEGAMVRLAPLWKAIGHKRLERPVAALAPWFTPETPASAVAGRKVLIVHGTLDRWTSPAQSLAFARRAAGDAAAMQYVALKGAGHFMLHRPWLWQTLTTGFVLKSFGETTGARVAPYRDFARLLPESAVQVTL